MRWRVEINAVHIRYIVLACICLHSLQMFNYIQLSSSSTTICNHMIDEPWDAGKVTALSHFFISIFLYLEKRATCRAEQLAECRLLTLNFRLMLQLVSWVDGGGFHKSKFLSSPSIRKHSSSCFSVERWMATTSWSVCASYNFSLQYGIWFAGMLIAWCESTT